MIRESKRIGPCVDVLNVRSRARHQDVPQITLESRPRPIVESGARFRLINVGCLRVKSDEAGTSAGTGSVEREILLRKAHDGNDIELAHTAISSRWSANRHRASEIRNGDPAGDGLPGARGRGQRVDKRIGLASSHSNSSLYSLTTSSPRSIA